MPTWIIQNPEYDMELLSLLQERLSSQGAVFAVSPALGGVGVRTEAAGLPGLCRALGQLLLKDMLPFEMERLVDRTPLPLMDKEQVVSQAVDCALEQADLSDTPGRLMAHLKRESRLCLEGFLHFRMQETVLFWQLCAEEATSALLMERELSEVAGVLQLMLLNRPPRCRTLRLCLHGDGVCSLSDGEELHMEYVDESGQGIISLLVGMAPARLLVYDLSGGRRQGLVTALTEIFLGRMCLYTGEF